ncbi:hypothetical protein OBBRIDRAFT_738047 [Obba rivulosa]|uniref:Alpha-type protein kinase domain-containing protein n=1 Tax=Obba rivulosa TaxID=1052685 RepID=A0A8E2DI22_9APHY|nr:hypothetical protein OBBRIDRAFT_738047 [Obba rivulosa]
MRAIIKKPNSFFQVENGVGISASLVVVTNATKMLGPAGGFKMAHPGRLFLVDPRAVTSQQSSLCMLLNQENRQYGEIAVKRWFYRDHKSKRQRMTQQDELPKMIIEADCLYWASALLRLAFEYIDVVLAKRKEQGDPIMLFITRQRFVAAALAIPATTNAEAAVYLLEEVINKPFWKYIVNHQLEPVATFKSQRDRQIALFLSFTQHVQYLQTSRIAFVSDYQGKHSIWPISGFTCLRSVYCM